MALINMNTSKRISFGLIAITALVGIFDFPLNCYAAGEKKLEVFSWWTSGGEAVALRSMRCSRYIKNSTPVLK
jgi:hypothetical protein